MPDPIDKIRVAERLDDLGERIAYLPDPARDRHGRRPFPITEIFDLPDQGARLVLHAFRREGGRSVGSYARTLPPGTGRFGAHLHRNFEERWLVYAGRASYRLRRERATLDAGEWVTFPAGVPHVDPYNDSDEPLELLSLISPPDDFTMTYGRTLGQYMRDGKLNRQQQFTPLQLMVILRHTRAETFAAGPPTFLQRFLVIPLVAAIGRLLGHRVAVW